MENQHAGIQSLNQFYARVYSFMGLGVGISALISYLALNVFPYQVAQFVNNFPLGFWGLWIVQIILVVVLGRKAQSNPSLAIGGFIGYAALNGITLSVTLFYYSGGTVVAAFVSAMAMFLGMAIFGKVTKRDLSGMARAAYGALIGIIIAMLLNVFVLQSSPVDLFISIIGVLIFAGLTAYDNQNIRNVYMQSNGTAGNGIAVFMALQLYLDFINLFLYLLRIFGRSNN